MTYMEVLGGDGGVIYLRLQVIGVLVVKPYLGVVTVGQAVAGHPVLLVTAAPRHHPVDQGGRAQVQLQPLVPCGDHVTSWQGRTVMTTKVHTETKTDLLQ